MIPPRFPPPVVPATAAADTATAPAPLPGGVNTVPHSAFAQTSQVQAGPVPPAETMTAHVPVSGRKRRLPPSPAPRSSRMRLDTLPLPASAAPVRTHAALQQQARAPRTIEAALRDFNMTWQTLTQRQQETLRAAAMHLPSGPASLDARQAAIRQRLHPLLSSIQERARLANQTQDVPQVIDPARFNAQLPAVHSGEVTIDGPHLDHAGQRHFYLEQQCGMACAQHAVNAMVGGPLVSLLQFARWEANVQAPQGAMLAPMEDIAATMLAQGVYPETVQCLLQEQGIPTHSYAHYPMDNDQGIPMLDPDQARFLDALKTDRLLLQADRYAEDGSTTSHYVAFRKDGDQWVLLDSQHPAAQYGVAPSTYLLHSDEIKHFTAIWPQHALQGRVRAVDNDDSMRAAQEEGAGAVREEALAPSRKRRQSAARAKAPPGLENSAAKDPKAEARARMAQKRKAGRVERLQERYGEEVKTEQTRKALVGGFKTKDGKIDTAAFSRYEKERTARNYTDAEGNHPFVKANGALDMTAFYRHRAKQTARNYTDAEGNHPFVKANGEIDMAAYHQHMAEQTARNYTDKNGNHPFVKANGEIDWPAFNRHRAEQTARNYTDKNGNHPFVKANGELNIAAYYRHRAKQKARNYTDAHGNHPFVKANGEIDMTAYKRHERERTARNYTDAHGNHPFVKANGEIDMTAYKRHEKEQTARNYTDAHGNHPFVKASGEIDMTAYKRHEKEQTARNYTDAHGNHPFVKASGEIDMTAFYRHKAEQTARKYMQAAGNEPFAEEKRIIGAYMLIAQQDGSHKKRSGLKVIWDAWHLQHLAMWLNQNHANVPYGLNSLQKLGSHRKDEEVEKVLERFRQITDAPPDVKKNIKVILDVFRWIEHRIEALLEKEKQAVEDREAAQFAVELEAELPLSQHTPHYATVTGAPSFEEALAQPPQPVPEVSGQQADIMLSHTPQAGEADAAAIEDLAAFSELEWNIPFDPPGMDMAFQDFENMLIDDDFFGFDFDDEADGGFEED